MNDTPQLPPDEAAMERALQDMPPLPLRPGLAEEILEPLEADASLNEIAVARELKQRLPVANARPTLWKAIESRLEGESTPETALEDGKIIPIFPWRDLTPIFKVAAVVAIGVFAASVWLQPKPTQPNLGSLKERPMNIGPVGRLDPSAVRPVSQRSEILWNQREGVVQKNKQVYETQRQRRQDRSFYQFDGYRIEDLVSREGIITKRLETF